MSDSGILTPRQYEIWKRQNDAHFNMREERAYRMGPNSAAWSIHQMVIGGSDENKRKAEEQAQINWLMKRKWRQKEDAICLMFSMFTFVLTYSTYGGVGASIFSVMAFGMVNLVVSLVGPTAQFDSAKRKRIKACRGEYRRGMTGSLRRYNNMQARETR